MRDLDDKVIYALNNSLPTKSIKARIDSNPEVNCKGLYDTLQVSYSSRREVIQDCIVLTADQISELKKLKESNSNDIELEKKFKSEQRKVIKYFYYIILNFFFSLILFNNTLLIKSIYV